MQSGHTYSASAWIQTADGPDMSEEDRQRANDVRDLLLKYGMTLSIGFQEKVGDQYEKRGNINLFVNRPKEAGTFSRPSSGYQDPASQINVTPEEIEFWWMNKYFLQFRKRLSFYFQTGQEEAAKTVLGGLSKLKKSHAPGWDQQPSYQEQHCSRMELLVYPRPKQLCVWLKNQGFFTRPMTKQELIDLAYNCLKTARQLEDKAE